jgi:hypothetical protein
MTAGELQTTALYFIPHFNPSLNANHELIRRIYLEQYVYLSHRTKSLLDLQRDHRLSWILTASMACQDTTLSCLIESNTIMPKAPSTVLRVQVRKRSLFAPILEHNDASRLETGSLKEQ